MGKSNKKLKNDRINIIRKQYDAFLEEDKKRRERNEYILGKLDKICTSTTLVPVTATVNYKMQHNQSDIFMRSKYIKSNPDIRDSYQSHLERKDMTSNILSKPLNDLRILKEISKNYILIPKSKTYDNDYIYSKDKDIINEDWKSKYNILDDLKKLDTEDHSNPVSILNNENNVHNNRLDLRQDNSDQASNNFSKAIGGKKSELGTVNKPSNCLVEQDKSNKRINFNVPEIISFDNEENKLQIPSIIESKKLDQIKDVQNDVKECIINAQIESVTEKEKFNTESNEKDLKFAQNFNYKSQKDENNKNNPTVKQENIKLSNYMSDTDPNKYLASESIKTDVSNVSNSDKIISDEKSQESCAAKYLEENVLLNCNINIQKDAGEMQESLSNKTSKLNESLDITQGQISTNDTSFDNPQYYDPTQNTIPVEVENTQHLGHVENESEINAFEVEQKEMFYSEQTHPDTYTYNLDESNTGEYTESYEQNDQYAYYENVEQQQGHSININEHEESTERYDPHYNQQYEASYENQQPEYQNFNEYEQQESQNENQAFENIVDYENQQVNEQLYQQDQVSNENETDGSVLQQENTQIFDQHLFVEQPNAQEQIEQQLITEEGYIESSHTIENTFGKENEGEIEKIVNSGSENSEELKPDPKLA